MSYWQIWLQDARKIVKRRISRGGWSVQAVYRYNVDMSRSRELITKKDVIQEIGHWTRGIRLYIGAGIGLLTIQLWWWARLVYDGGELMTSRLHEAYGWAALCLLAGALVVGPAYKLLPRLPGAPIMRDARRLLGVGAAWFAILHGSVAWLASFQGINPLQLTSIYQRGFLLGGLALAVLLAMAFTSFDAAFRRMGIWWFRLHRFIYAAAPLVVWHALSIGVHAPGLPALAIVVSVGVILFIMHMQAALQQDKVISGWQIASLCAMGIVIVALANYGVQLYIAQNSLQGHGH